MTLLREIKEIPSTKFHLRRFGWTLGAVFGLIGGVLFWRGREGAVYFLAVSGFFLVFGTLLPTALKAVQKIWMTAALLMGWLMSRVILTVLFYLVVAPLGVLLRLSGKDLLDLKPVSRESHWQPRKARPKEDYENQF